MKKSIASIFMTLCITNTVFGANIGANISIENNLANVSLSGVSQDVESIQVNIIDKNNNSDINFTPNKDFYYSNVTSKTDSNGTTISILIDGAVIKDGNINLGNLQFGKSPNLSENISVEFVNINNSLVGKKENITATISNNTNNNSNNSSSNGSNNNSSYSDSSDSSSNSNNSDSSSSKPETTNKKPSQEQKPSTPTNTSNTENSTSNTQNVNIDKMYPVIKNVHFPDSIGHWASLPIKYLADRGIINGFSPDEFKPNNNITRAEFITILAKMDNIDVTKYKSNSFKDVSASDWFNPYIDWALKNGITSGTSKDLFSPKASISREQMAVFIDRFCAYKNFSLNPKNDVINFVDNSKISDYAKNSILKVQKAGVINGRPNGEFAPKDNATRAEAAQMIYTMLQIQ